MGRTRQTTDLLVLKGIKKKAIGKFEAMRGKEPAPRGPLGMPPAEMPEKVQAAWMEIVELSHRGTLSDSDRLVVEELSYLLVRCRAKQFEVSPAILSRFEQCLGKLGMTPADRSRVQVDKSRLDENPFGKFSRAA
jgi:hypothetical protein